MVNTKSHAKDKSSKPAGAVKSTRPNWDEFFTALTLFYSTRGTCDRLRAGCILVKENMVVSAGYNGSLPGESHCDDAGHLMVEGHCLRTLHSEINAIRNCKNPDLLKGATAYLIATPCFLCLKALLGYGVGRIVFTPFYDNASYEWTDNKEMKKFIDSVKSKNAVSIEFSKVDFRELFQKFTDRLQGPGGVLKDLPSIKLVYENEGDVIDEIRLV